MKLYLDTSVYGGYYDDEFLEDTRLLFNCINHHKIHVIASEIVMSELSPARKDVRDVINLLHDFELVSNTDGVKELAMKYLKSGILGNGSMVDATHIAMATLRGATTVVSWNMKHMVSRQDQFNMVNLQNGHRTINIYKPSIIIKAYNYEKKI